MNNIYLEGDAEVLVEELGRKARSDDLTKSELELYRKIRKALKHLEQNPRHPGLHSHEITSLTRMHGVRIWESYLENKKPGARRIFWIYGPNKREISIIGIERHPEPNRGYSRVKLAKEPIEKVKDK